MQPLMTPGEVAELLQVSQRKAYALKDEIGYVELGGNVRFERDAVQAYIERCKRSPRDRGGDTMGVTVRYRAARDRWVVIETGERGRYQCSFTTEEDAEEYATKRRAELNEARFNGVMGRARRKTFMEGLLRWVEEYDTESQGQAFAGWRSGLIGKRPT
ncbi:helix-turn-helix domain-containing protein [Billgrantia aerodenitrificans]|uniref:Helix-turn-helix domain-containing protein n=1 Tax=Billgrantia aerodenitrificans TaxID=2733483 RepID=A0ABS9AVB8_9GAMM|nr:helix-turn-helix domain-containing protein [Halomonas aerodenitrificans]MCE8025828.1 helix-turn-helix domain-containing protein [Halomonas aerodenitrificans]